MQLLEKKELEQKELLEIHKVLELTVALLQTSGTSFFLYYLLKDLHFCIFCEFQFVWANEKEGAMIRGLISCIRELLLRE